VINEARGCGADPLGVPRSSPRSPLRVGSRISNNASTLENERLACLLGQWSSVMTGRIVSVRTLGFGLGLILALAGSSVLGQANQDAPAIGAEQASLARAERSWAIQRRLAAIDKDRHAYIDALIAGWAPYLDSRLYDQWSELQPIMEQATPWRLYGASLVGRFETMVEILRGRQSAGRVINAWSEPQPKTWTTPGEDLGEIDQQLVFTPIPPCRMVDTRGSGARTGILALGVPRAFDLTTLGYGKGQGGQTAGCTGLPSFSHYGWAVNITTVGYTGIGGLKAFPFFGAEPAASIINYVPDGWAIANNGHVTGCYGCGDDITLLSFFSPTHVIVDVMGYYQAAPVFEAVTTLMAGASTLVPENSSATVTGGECPPGTTLIGGELDFVTGSSVMIGEMARASSTQMRFVAVNQSASVHNAVAYSVCQETPVRR
jgi:hypothetical protein